MRSGYNRVMHTRCLWPLLLLAAAGLACDLASPPLEVTYRDSLVGAGKVLQITNHGERELKALRVKVETPAGEEKEHIVESLAAGESIEVGWLKLEGFEIPPGAEVSIRCDGYPLPYRTVLPG